MKKLVLTCATAPLFVAAQTAYAQEYGAPAETKGYFELGYIRAGVDINETDVNLDFNIIEGRAGYRFNKYLAAEVALGGASGTTNVDNTNLDVGINYTVGAFGRVDIPIGDRFAVFGRAGYSQYTFDFHADYLPENTFVYDDEKGPSFGGGVVFDVTQNFAVRLEATSHSFEDTDVVGAGIFGVMMF